MPHATVDLTGCILIVISEPSKLSNDRVFILTELIISAGYIWYMYLTLFLTIFHTFRFWGNSLIKTLFKTFHSLRTSLHTVGGCVDTMYFMEPLHRVFDLFKTSFFAVVFTHIFYHQPKAKETNGESFPKKVE